MGIKDASGYCERLLAQNINSGHVRCHREGVKQNNSGGKILELNCFLDDQESGLPPETTCVSNQIKC